MTAENRTKHAQQPTAKIQHAQQKKQASYFQRENNKTFN